MAVIRVPESSSDLLQFVKGSTNERPALSLFPTYAHLVAASAGLAVAKGLPPARGEFKEQDPRPIDYSVFRNQGLHHALLAFAIAHTSNSRVCTNLDEMCKVIEVLADAGCGLMRDLLHDCGVVYWPGEWENLVTSLLHGTSSPEDS